MWQDAKNVYHLGKALVANAWFGIPSKSLKVIGVTGTDGKTTTCSAIYQVLKAAGKKVSVVTTVYADVAGKIYDTGFHVTTPDSFDIQHFLRLSADNTDEYFVLETTSHGLHQNRLFGIDFYAGVITNITHEHLDYHKTYENYVAAKLRLLDNATYKFVNFEDKSYSYIEKKQYENITSYGLSKGDVHFDISKKLGTKIPYFNKYNFLAVYALAKHCGIEEKRIFSALSNFQSPPGRMQVVMTSPYTIINDFAHTPGGFESLYKTILELYKRKDSRIIHVFGSAAQRDTTKRPIMGKIASEHADYIVLTEEDYRTEDPEKIANEIAEGFIESFARVNSDTFGATSKQYIIETNREKAIHKAIEIAKTGDIILTTGKGHEKSLCRGTVEHDWDEVKVIKEGVKS